MIPVTYRASFSYLLRHPWQLILSLLGIVIGVAVIVAVDLANSSARKAFLLSMDAIAGEATHQVIGGPNGVSERVYRDLRTRHGLINVAPVVEGTVNVDGVPVQLLGIDLFAEQAVRSFTGETTADDAGDDNSSLFVNFLLQPGAVPSTEQTAQDLGLEIGNAFAVSVGGRPQSATLFATFAGDSSLDRVFVTDIATAQEWLDRPGWLSRIDVRMADGDTAMLDRLEAALPSGTQLP